MRLKTKRNDKKPINPIDELFKLLKKNARIKEFLEKPLDRRSFIIVSVIVLGLVLLWMFVPMFL